MTEGEAKKKICPIFTSAGWIAQCITHTAQYDKETFKSLIQCHASDCMMWRWLDNEREEVEGDSDNPPDKLFKWERKGNKFTGIGQRPFGKQIWARTIDERNGYCGLGG